ncbi:hypothetical protein FRC02_006814 [Tulasnella sp. 418]|nr:hypothetical protein FRC02_006814 [Tulasnella sp. 418]
MKSLDIHDILHFLHRFSSISHLLLGNISFIRKADPDAQIPLPPSFELYEFMWINSNHSSVDSSKAAFCYIADWLFQKSPTCPRMFRLDDVDYVAQYEMLSYFLNNYGANLTSLWTMCRDWLICDHFAETCPKLRELVLFNSVLLSPEFRLTIPITDLEHLGLFILTKGNHRREEYLELIDWIVKIPNLVCLTQGAWGFREERDWDFARE